MPKCDGHVTTLHPGGSENDCQPEGVREVKRPVVHYADAARRVFLVFLFGVAAMGLAKLLCWAMELGAVSHFAWAAACVVWVATVLWRRNAILIWFVRVYQARATSEIRASCLFEPSCSEYMILSIEKYGTVRGVWKGLRRLGRCRAPNGGIDYP